MNEIAERYAPHGVGSIFLYTHEAHPGENYPHLTSMEQKYRHARALRDLLGVTRPILLDALAAERDPNIPDLPFFDNPDPDQCGIPIIWGSSNDKAWLTGMYEGELVQPTVLLYDSHLRMQITAEAPHGTAVTIIMYQQNPVVDYYYVQIDGVDGPNKGWLPAPFL